MTVVAAPRLAADQVPPHHHGQAIRPRQKGGRADPNAVSHPNSGTHWSKSLTEGTEPAHPTAPLAPMSRAEDDFYWDDANEPHAIRRAAILKAHPEIKSLMGPCPRTKYIIFATLAFQTTMCWLLSSSPWWLVWLCTYAISGTLNHMMMMAVHEISHNLASKSGLVNRILAIVANMPMGIPAAASFRRYHLEHHKYQGEHIVDVDVPLRAEAILFNSLPGKVLWCILQPLFYSLRPFAVNPKPPGRWEFITAAVVFSFDAWLYYMFGLRAIVYTVMGSLLGMGLHPVAGHFIAEHYVFRPGQETYSYYGLLNLVTFNVGYHNEHHDFANIPGSRLPQVKKLAPEFYDSLPSYKSWTGVIIDFILNGDICGFSRVKRETLSQDQRERIKERDRQNNM